MQVKGGFNEQQRVIKASNSRQVQLLRQWIRLDGMSAPVCQCAQGAELEEEGERLGGRNLFLPLVDQVMLHLLFVLNLLVVCRLHSTANSTKSYTTATMYRDVTDVVVRTLY